jgi:hypothetical protein
MIAISLALFLAAVPSSERVPVGIVLLRPSTVTASSAIEAARPAFSELTSLEIRSSEEVGISSGALDQCPAESRFTCWALAADPVRARFLIVASILPFEEATLRVTSSFLDVPTVHRWAKEDDPSSIEPRVFAAALHAAPAVIPRGDRRALEGYFRHLVERELRGLLEAEALYGPPIRIAGPAPAREERSALLRWGGLGVAAVGLGVLVASAIASSQEEEVCLVRTGDSPSCPSLHFPLVPTSIGLIAAGGTWTGAQAIDSELEPWIAIAATTALGAIAFAITLGARQ